MQQAPIVPARREGDNKEPSKAKELAALLEAHRGERHIIVIQSFPDPDAISSALAHQLISERFGVETDIAYDGVISHHENVALVELLGIQLLRVREEHDLKQYQASVFIDTPGTTTGLTIRLEVVGVPVLAIVDHHEPQGIVEAKFTDIRTDTNATATIYSEYLQEGGLIIMDRADTDHERVATALMHGIRSETGGFIRAERADFLAASYLVDFVDHTALEAILSVQRSRAAMDVIKTALEARDVRANYSIAGVGYLRYEDRDAIPEAADFLLTEENVHTAIVYGIVTKSSEREVIIGSLRTKKTTLNPDTFLKEALGGADRGHYYGGGRRGAGGFEIPVEFLQGSYGEGFMSAKWKLYDEQIQRRILTRLGVQEVRQTTVEVE